jgi:hypothetical protein
MWACAVKAPSICSPKSATQRIIYHSSHLSQLPIAGFAQCETLSDGKHFRLPMVQVIVVAEAVDLWASRRLRRHEGGYKVKRGSGLHRIPTPVPEYPPGPTR